MITDDELTVRFTYHKPSGTHPQRYEALRRTALEYAREILLATPESREQSLALTALEEAVMLANAALARRENAVTA